MCNGSVADLARNNRTSAILETTAGVAEINSLSVEIESTGSAEEIVVDNGTIILRNVGG